MTINLNGKWRNQYNSEMDLAVVDNRVSGTFQTAIGQPSFEEKFEISGKINNNVIAFMVDFGKYGSLACWTGRFELDEMGPVIHTMWHLSQSDGGEEEQMAKAILTGVGTFRKP
ncbi:avidin/streptavidin family protein [Marinifilum fragile]|jgi:Avidin family.|uniref:avidin/streptavidin family protein n=1 Tax=Marinifilum fragile TaxID=570161 RepID=UPI0006D1AED7|nr:avidin/streptavidin family protein [Marinifilum fragile]